MKIYKIANQNQLENYIDKPVLIQWLKNNNISYNLTQDVIYFYNNGKNYYFQVYNDECERMDIDDLTEYIAKDQFIEIISKSNVTYKTIGDVLSINSNGNNYYFGDYGDQYEKISDICSYISSMSTDTILSNLNLSEEDIYIDALEATIKDLKENLDKVYHWTTKDALEEINESGYLNPSYGTGINNRNAFGIFTTTEIEEYADGTYGDVCLEIDVGAFRNDMDDIENVDITIEPEIIEYHVYSHFSYMLGADCIFDYPRDISPYTILLNHKIPIQYITVLK